MADVEHTHLPTGVDTYSAKLADGSTLTVANEPMTANHDYKGGTITIQHADHTALTFSTHPSAGTIVFNDKNEIQLDVTEHGFETMKRAMASAEMHGFNIASMKEIARAAESEAQRMPTLDKVGKPQKQR